ncbi:MAG: tRNA pseudouridine(38-40) synthase TruA [Vicinamibacterales bacterium]
MPENVRRTLKLTIQYDGTEYVGWQRQANGVSVQGLLEQALRPIAGAHVDVFGAGRTDAGVHALGQVASCRLTLAIPPQRLVRALNAVLPRDIRVVDAEDVPGDFHARFSATGKVYEYRIINDQAVSPFLRRFVWHVIPALDLDAMREASALLLGRHDFAAFQAVRATVRSTERTIRRLDWIEGTGNDEPWRMQIEGDGFLRHMVRTITGTLVQIGLRRWPVEYVTQILASRSRISAGTTAPPAGLFLMRVLY